MQPGGVAQPREDWRLSAEPRGDRGGGVPNRGSLESWTGPRIESSRGRRLGGLRHRGPLLPPLLCDWCSEVRGLREEPGMADLTTGGTLVAGSWALTQHGQEQRAALAAVKQNGQICCTKTVRGLRQGQETEQNSPCEPSLSAIMAAIHDLKGSLEPRLDAVVVDVTLLQADLKKVLEKVTTAETDIAHLQFTSKQLEDQVRFLTVEHKRLAARLEDQEGRVWRNNIRVTGVPEGVEGLSVELFMETLITDYLRPKRLSTFFMAEWAHSTQSLLHTREPPRGQSSICASLILGIVMPSYGLLGHKGNCSMRMHVCFFPNFTLKVQRQRQSFLEVKRALRGRELMYMMLFPARLRLIVDCKTWHFATPEEA
ncbi:hypothetical protein NDU88_003929 [Pleurodeles waltl]|uniref:Uncharacterized protein n=1 Tax=Pleurodeles waltl TaxID=8319 RepID=A0AAV7WU35_PLEWA|nr:hypothetical protein NDU88_003929 [Pleurodeles waltl]